MDRSRASRCLGRTVLLRTVHPATGGRCEHDATAIVGMQCVFTHGRIALAVVGEATGIDAWSGPQPRIPIVVSLNNPFGMALRQQQRSRS